MKTIKNSLLVITFINACVVVPVLLSGCNYNKKEIEIPTATGITDLVLIYHTHTSRLQWMPEQIKHYIYRLSETGTPEWMFDGLLFLEFIMEHQGNTYGFDLDAYGRIYADKPLWERLAKETFAEGRGPDAAEIVLSGLAEQGYYPPYKRQIVFSLPTPPFAMEDWGEIKGRKMDFHKTEDRVEALNWYIDLIIDEWNKKDYKYLNLAGFYWTKEFIVMENDNEVEVLNTLKERLASEGYEFSWIPYYGAEGVPEWKVCGFDIAYQQPNHFFNTNTPDWFLPESIKYAKTHGLNMEMEFDERVEDPAFGERFYKYIDEFEKAGVWQNMPVAHYQGNYAWLLMAESNRPELKAMHKKFGDILSARQGRFSRIITK